MSILESPQMHADLRSMSSANPDAEGANFRLAMREFASGVTIIACGERDSRAGCTATAVASLSVSPPSLVVCLSLSAATLQSLRRNGAFSVNVLGAEHTELAERFSGRGGVNGADRFDLGDWAPLVTGAPVLADALAAMDCLVEDIVERHTHAIIIGAVQAVRTSGAKSALLHWRSRFESL
jgi:flavin reductase (DIM6/NTAB) family NADH-FMN oxidoreductase RutF